MRVLCMGEVLLRYATPKGKRLQDLCFDVHVGGSESNVAVNLSCMGVSTQLFTKLSDHLLGEAVIRFLKTYGVDTTKIIRAPGRVGSYYLESGSGQRASQVIYDRDFSVMTTLQEDEIDLVKLFADVSLFVVSGITVALNPTLKKIVLKMLKYCKAQQIMVAYDVNYRAKLWDQETAGIALKEILPYVTILSAGELDAVSFLQLQSQQDSLAQRLLAYDQQITAMYPNIEYIVCTDREIISASVNHLTGYLYHRGKLLTSQTYCMDDIVDRVGGGDAFFAGILYGILQAVSLDKTLALGIGAACLKHTISGDVNPFTIEEIENFVVNQNQRIVR